MPQHEAFTVQQLEEYFHMPLKKAAMLLGTYEGALIRACRRHDIAKWPYRQLAKIDRQMRYMDEVMTKLHECNEPTALDKTTARRRQLQRRYAVIKENTCASRRSTNADPKLLLSFILNP
ncbi:hypothetical protein H310_06054 [Aphanomyces invadans]|uniref:RWP-RK domain-containing protein n=1 Tax=Aphanomyces invadans TaxID=157072 RepID=A0A024U8N2_9STRA|nr:hypothetical protein H310_06054 [Aphanomyces invadans]ETW02575.1 hypothetical protein H310_06054 [Aphanomyces invadans]|eukprot:XP_008869180.1 hypothetical protein H310_06054 [Aphanomyces invadans]